ncbi:hypothetical protein CERZMDRAFT_98458 [Cercospora zeae-maydis SCOH1-5]|uniref:Uncharacterized protein n=1 Tax=Cercospora zeae-maydis SCOH1-5 TaxID=717836 RepID=A0A6A6FDS4_9PEZI|nr:hypothetical protein CERZMDRAFT_98458 [Cercospora zeae-maydis SCOH1-5]
MPYKALKDCVIVTAGSGEKDWNTNQISTWIKEASGTFERAVTDKTTHLVVTRKLWETSGMIVQEALRRQRQGQQINIVNFDWLDHCFGSRSKKKEKPYRFSTKDSSASSSKGDAAPGSHTGLLKELYLENTELTPAQQKLNEKRQAMEETLAKERAAEKEEERRRHMDKNHSLTELGHIFKKGARKANAILLNSNHHIYQDPTGFYYDITLTKVDTARNTNERYNLVLQIFESNSVPHTYAFSTTFSGTKLAQTDNVVVSIGANFPTAMRAFRNCFEEKTGVDWNDRLAGANDRSQHEGSTKHLEKVGEYARDQLGVSRPTGVADLRKQKFKYYPPSYGSVGQLDTSATETINGFQSSPQAGVKMTNDEDGTDTVVTMGAGIPIQAVFGPSDVEKLHEAQTVANELGETLDPMAAPFDFGESADLAEMAGLASEGDREPAMKSHYGDATGYMDSSSYPPPRQTFGEQESTPHVASLGKRKDSGATELADNAKKPKLDSGSGEYIVETTPEVANYDREQ